MKFSAQEEYGLRCLLRIAQDESENGMTIPEISEAEGLSSHTVAKLLRALRIGGLLESERGQTGGYSLTRKPDEISVGEALAVLGGRLYDENFCAIHSGIKDICTHTIDCSIRSLWRIIQDSVDGVVGNLTLQDLLSSENEIIEKVSDENYDNKL